MNINEVLHYVHTSFSRSTRAENTKKLKKFFFQISGPMKSSKYIENLINSYYTHSTCT